MIRTRDPQDILIYKRTRAKAKKITNNAQSINWQNYCSSISFNIKLNQIWSTIKRFNKQANSIHIKVIELNDISTTSKTEKADIMLTSHFQSTNSNENYSSTFINSFPLTSYILQHKLHYQSY